MISVVMAVANALLDGGTTNSLIRDPDCEESDYSTVFFFHLTLSLLMVGLIYFLAPLIAEFYEQPILVEVTRVYSITIIINALSIVQFARLTKIMDFKTQTIIAIPSAVIGGIVGITMALSGYGVWSLVWSSIVTATFNSVQLWIYSKWTPELSFNYGKFKIHFNYGYKLTLSELLDRIFNNIFLIVIGKYFSPAQVGFYTRAETMKQLPVTNLSNALNRVTFPLFVTIQNDEVRLKRVYKKLMQMVVFVITPVLIILAILAEPTFRFLFTEKWLPAVPYFQILCITGILYPLHSYNLTILNVKGRSDLFLKLEVFKKLLIIITLIITIPLGIMAMLYGQIVISIIAFFINAHYTGKFINYSALQQLKDVFPIVLLSVIVGLFIYAIDNYGLDNNLDLIRIMVGGVVGFSIYIFAAYKLKFESYQELSKLILKK